MPGWIGTAQIVLGVITIILTYQQLQKMGILEAPLSTTTTLPSGVDFVDPSIANDPIERGKGILTRFLDWIEGETHIGVEAVPNWIVLICVIVVLYAIFRK